MYCTLYVAEILFYHKEQRDNGDIIEIKIMKVKISSQTSEGVSYSCVYVRDGKRLLGYDNFEGHEEVTGHHHRHIHDHVAKYEFIDEWKLIEDFYEDVKKIREGVIQ